MSRYRDQFSELKILKLLHAYLNEGWSHRVIQRQILELPAPQRGGGFVAMDILHSFCIRREHKGILASTSPNEEDLASIFGAVRILDEYKAIEEGAKKAVEDNSCSFSDIVNTEVLSETKRRIGHDVLRTKVLENYKNQCALCDIHQSDLLICSHIIPWRTDKKNRLNPSNAIAFCKLHDGLFDKGYFSLNDEYQVILMDKADKLLRSLMEGLTFKAPDATPPEKTFLKFHREVVCG